MAAPDPPAERVELRPQPGPQERFAACLADIALYGGAAGGGKSFALLMEPLYHTDNPDFGAVIFRRTCPEITNEGGLWDESFKLYPHARAEPRASDLSWRFPKGSSVSFGHIQREADVLKWHSSQIALIEFDELTTFTEHQFFYMLSRNRSTCGVRPYIRAGCNPDAASWVARLVEWWIDPSTGLPVPARAGVLRWFVRDGETLRWAGTREELLKSYPDLAPKSITFIPARLEDNKKLALADPNYRANLMALPRVERERLLRGNWLIAAAEGEWPAEYFGRHLWFSDWPADEDRSCCTIAWDPSKGTDSRYGDYSAFTVLVRDTTGRLYADAVMRQRWPVEDAIDAGIELAREWKPDVFTIEANQFQSLVVAMFRKRAVEVLGFAPDVHPLDNRVNKDRRIARLGKFLRDRSLRLRGDSTGARLLAEQLMVWPNGEHDDGPDALEMALRVMIEWWNQQAARKGRPRR